MNEAQPSSSGPLLANRIDRRAWSTISRQEYIREYVLPLKPLIITGGFDHWPARKKWRLDFFEDRYGGLPLEVDGRSLSMATLIDEVRASTPERPGPYLRNHRIKELPAELQQDILPTPECTGPNWLEHPRLKRWNDLTYMELYIGGAGAKFPMLHYDGLHTHAFLMQLEGVKEYIAFSPDQTPFLYAGAGGPYDENRSAIGDIDSPDLTRFPLFSKASGVRFALHPGETLFVPAGWWHTARILFSSITVSVNGANASNWKDFRHDFCRSYWAAHKLRRAIGSVCLSLTGALFRLTEEVRSHLSR